MERGQCLRCEWWVWLLWESLGECRCGPPTAEHDTCEARWPETAALDWCGQFRPRESPLEERGASGASRPAH